ncbi:MAG: hypothetical protein L0220_26275, partial [Acidobacteria bacterium]|nr:hypothetical protein [Acidobacteriota bacterium]
QISVKNENGRYSPSNPASSGYLVPNVPARIYADISGSSYPMFSGRVDEYRVSPELPTTTTILCRDDIKGLRTRVVTTSLFVDYNAGSLFTEVLQQSNVQSYAVDPLFDTLNFTWFRDTPASTAINELIKTGFYFARVKGNGAIEIANRYFDQGTSPTGSYGEMLALPYALNDDRVINRAKIEGVPRKVLDVSTVAYVGEPIKIPSSGFVSFALEYLDPVNNEPAPALGLILPTLLVETSVTVDSGGLEVSSSFIVASGSDWLLNAADTGSGADLTLTSSVAVTFYGQTAVNTVFNGSGTEAYLTKFQLRGQPVSRLPRFTLESNDSSSQAIYGIREFGLSSELMGNATFARDYAEFLKIRNKSVVPELSLMLRNHFPDVLTREIGEQIHITNSFLGVSSIYIISRIEHTVSTDPGQIHQLNMILEQFREQNLLVLNDAVRGKLDERTLGL